MQHEFPAGFTFELAYVGRLGNHLLQALDLAEPVDFTDPNGGGDYYTAGSTLSKEVDEHGGNQFATCADDTRTSRMYSRSWRIIVTPTSTTKITT